MPAGGLDDAVLVVTDGEGGVLGSCFCAPILDSSRAGTYLISTAHGLLVDARRGNQIVVVDRTGRAHRADIVVCATGSEPDVGLLYIGQSIGRSVECVSPPSAGDVLIRGALSGLDTRIGVLRGWHSGLESLAGEQMMDVIVEDLGLLERRESSENARSLAYASLRGVSGAPVCRADGGEVLVYGMVVRRNTGGITNRVYALPVDVLRRFLGQRGYPLRVTRQFEATPHSASMLMGQLITRQLGRPGGLHQLWVDASGLFYSGVPIDATLQDAIRQPEHFGLAGLQVAELEFLLARLLFKRGDEQGGLAMLRRARRLAGRSSATEHQHLAALIDLRMVLQSARDLSPARRRSVFERGVGAYEDSQGTSDDERAYEVASAVGSEATQLASDLGFVRRDGSARRHFSGLLAKHTGLLAEYPQLLRDKQEIVNIGLSAIEILWDVDESRDPIDRSETLAALAARGRLAAIQRGNGIFYAQMLLADSIAARMSRRPYRAFALAAAVGRILSSSHLRLSHEGVRSYLSYVDEHDDVVADVLRTAHSVDPPIWCAAPCRADLAPQPDSSALDAALIWCQSVYTGISNVGDIFELENILRDL